MGTKREVTRQVNPKVNPKSGTHPIAKVGGQRVREPIALNDIERSRICLEADVSLNTIERWARGFPVHRTTEVRIRKAIAKLGIQLRQRPAPASDPRRRVVDVGEPQRRTG